jgi:hypothetical protein
MKGTLSYPQNAGLFFIRSLKGKDAGTRNAARTYFMGALRETARGSLLMPKFDLPGSLPEEKKPPAERERGETLTLFFDDCRCKSLTIFRTATAEAG